MELLENAASRDQYLKLKSFVILKLKMQKMFACPIICNRKWKHVIAMLGSGLCQVKFNHYAGLSSLDVPNYWTQSFNYSLLLSSSSFLDKQMLHLPY